MEIIIPILIAHHVLYLLFFPLTFSTSFSFSIISFTFLSQDIADKIFGFRSHSLLKAKTEVKISNRHFNNLDTSPMTGYSPGSGPGSGSDVGGDVSFFGSSSPSFFTPTQSPQNSEVRQNIPMSQYGISSSTNKGNSNNNNNSSNKSISSGSSSSKKYVIGSMSTKIELEPSASDDVTQFDVTYVEVSLHSSQLH